MGWEDCFAKCFDGIHGRKTAWALYATSLIPVLSTCVWASKFYEGHVGGSSRNRFFLGGAGCVEAPHLVAYFLEVFVNKRL